MFGDTNVAPAPAQAGPPYGQRERLGITNAAQQIPEKFGGGRGIRTPKGPAPRWISSPLPYQLRLALREQGLSHGRGGRGAARVVSLRRPREADEAVHVRSEHGRDRHTPVCFLAVLEHRDQRPADGQAGAVEGVAVVDLTATGRAVADLGPARLERLAVRA